MFSWAQMKRFCASAANFVFIQVKNTQTKAVQHKTTQIENG